MAIKISGSTIIDDSRVLINTGNVGVGTTNPTSAVDAGNTSVVHAGIVTANYLYGDGSNITNAPGFEPDADENLVAGDSAGANLDGSTACFNLLLGDDAGKQLTGGERNIFLGKYAGKGNSSFTASNSIAIGCGALGLASSSLGVHNIGIGEQTLRSATGLRNLAIGPHAGMNVSSGCYNIMFGYESGGCNTTGCYNIFLGHLTGKGSSQTTGNNNILLGLRAGRCISSGANNVFIGECIGADADLTGANNIAIGKFSGFKLSSGANNISMGDCAGKCTTTGCYNIFFGSQAGCTNTTGCDNLYFGECAGQSATTGCYNIFLGKAAGGGAQVTGNDNVVAGRNSGCALTSGNNNVFLGNSAGRNNDDGAYNVAIGAAAGCKLNTDADNNVVIGKNSGRCITSGSNNVFLGTESGCGICTGNYNVFLGHRTGENATTGCYNIFLGAEAGEGISAVTGNHNIAAGTLSGTSLGGGQYNIFFGACAGKCSQGASQNIFLGRCAGCTNTSGTGNIAIGNDVLLPSATADCQLAIGNGTNHWITGDSNFNVGIGTNTDAAVGSGVTAKLSVGIVSAYQLYGDGSNLTNLPASGSSYLFNTSVSHSVNQVATGIGTTAVTLPSTAGKQYIVHSILATNVASGNTDVNFIGAFKFDGGETSYFGYQIPIQTGMAVEMLKQPQILNPSDEIVIRSTDYDQNGADDIVDVYISYEEQTATDFQGVGLGAVGLAATSVTTVYTSSSNPSVIQSIRLANRKDTGAKSISVLVGDRYLVDNLIVPKYASIELLDQLKRIETDDTIKVQLDEGGSIDVQVSAKKIS